jgi:alanyl aminopeptidase
VIHGDQYLKVLTGFSGDSNPLVIAALAEGVGAAKAAFLTEENEAAFAAYVRRVLGPSLRRFGLDRGPKEDEAISLVRPTLVAWLGDEGKDEEVLARAETLARSFMRDRGSIDPSLVGPVLRLSAIRGDSTLFEEYRRRFESATAPTDREPYLKALGDFRDPELRRRALAYDLSGPLRPH